MLLIVLSLLVTVVFMFFIAVYRDYWDQKAHANKNDLPSKSFMEVLKEYW